MVSKMLTYGLAGLVLGVAAPLLFEEIAFQLGDNVVPALLHGELPMLKSYAWQYLQSPFGTEVYLATAAVLGVTGAILGSFAGAFSEQEAAYRTQRERESQEIVPSALEVEVSPPPTDDASKKSMEPSRPLTDEVTKQTRDSPPEKT